MQPALLRYHVACHCIRFIHSRLMLGRLRRPSSICMPLSYFVLHCILGKGESSALMNDFLAARLPNTAALCCSLKGFVLCCVAVHFFPMQDFLLAPFRIAAFLYTGLDQVSTNCRVVHRTACWIVLDCVLKCIALHCIAFVVLHHIALCPGAMYITFIYQQLTLPLYAPT